jgi:hypothetical protein
MLSSPVFICLLYIHVSLAVFSNFTNCCIVYSLPHCPLVAANMIDGGGAVDNKSIQIPFDDCGRRRGII